MKPQSQIAILCILLALAPWTYAQQQQPGQTADTTPRLETESPHWYSRFTQRYEPRIVPPINMSNSNRLESLMRAGNLYLSLTDAIAAALENNIDIEVQRYNFQLAEVDLARTKAGGASRAATTAVAAGAANAGGGGGGAGGGGGGGGAGGGGAAVAGGGGTAIPSLDPVLTGNIQWGHFTQPQNNTIQTGTTSIVTTQKVTNFGISQGFLTGTTANLGFNNSNSAQNAFLNNYNPTTSSNLDLQVSQHLLQGFGMAINSRNIRVSKNNLKVSDYNFQQQLISTVANIVQLYWNLVSYVQDVEVKKQSLALSQKLYEDNKKQVEIGTLAPIEIVRAEAEVATREQDLVTSQTNVLQQETILKNALSRIGVASATLTEAHVIPTDHITIPEVEPIRPVQDLVSQALDRRPDLSQTRLQLENSKINLTGSRNSMLPTLDLVADVRNNALSGEINGIRNPVTGLVPPHTTDPFFVGGYGNVLGQLFGRNFPSYSVGVQLNIPLRNRTAQADYTTAQLQLRQSELQLQKSINQVRVDVQNALIGVQQARARFQTATKSRVLQEQTLDAEQKKYALGASTVYNVIQAQRDLATARQNEVLANSAYALAKATLDQSTGMILERYNVEIDEAKSGKVSKAPSPIPDVPNGGGNAATASR